MATGHDRGASRRRSATPLGEVLGSWREIAAYLQRDVRTVMAWERSRGLPVHRLPGGPNAAVYALKQELQAWRLTGGAAGDEPGDPGPHETAYAALKRLRPVKPLLTGPLVLALVIVSGFLFRLTAPGRGAPSIRSVAVLPFQNLNKDPSQAYLADGMHETLVTSLARSSGIPVTARTSVDVYRGTRAPTRQIARELGVDALVEGSVLRVGNRVRITAQLVRGDTGEHVWANSYDGDVADALAVMTQVANAITGEIRKALAGSDAEPHGPAPPPTR